MQNFRSNCMICVFLRWRLFCSFLRNVAVDYVVCDAGNLIGDKGATALAAALRKNDTLTSLLVDGECRILVVIA